MHPPQGPKALAGLDQVKGNQQLGVGLQCGVDEGAKEFVDRNEDGIENVH